MKFESGLEDDTQVSEPHLERVGFVQSCFAASKKLMHLDIPLSKDLPATELFNFFFFQFKFRCFSFGGEGETSEKSRCSSTIGFLFKRFTKSYPLSSNQGQCFSLRSGCTELSNLL